MPSPKSVRETELRSSATFRSVRSSHSRLLDFPRIYRCRRKINLKGSWEGRKLRGTVTSVLQWWTNSELARTRAPLIAGETIGRQRTTALFAEKFPGQDSGRGKMERAVSSFRTFRHIASGSALSGFPFIYIPARIAASDDPRLNVHSTMCRECKNLGL